MEKWKEALVVTIPKADDTTKWRMRWHNMVLLEETEAQSKSLDLGGICSKLNQRKKLKLVVAFF